ncbi:MAG: ABC transporter ATP-binding protein [archaeon]|nr:ABC transporter ATP-binding protein [Candidatus Micrarchaeota archaeon]
MKEVLVEAKNVTKEYHLGHTIVQALRGVSIDVKDEDFVIIVGPSGSGKSTLLHLLGALDHPTKGQVFIGGLDTALMDEWSLAMVRRKQMGFIFQTFNLIPTLTALENVMIPTEPMNVSEEEVMERAANLLKTVGLGNRISHKPDELSGGERQRVSIARALINDPELIYADEPTGNLDTVTGGKIIDLMINLNKKEGKTFVMVTHDTSLLKYANKRVFLRDGLVQKVEASERK